MSFSMNKRLLFGVSKRSIVLALVCGVLLLVVVFGIVIKSVSANISVSPSTGVHHGQTPLTSASPSATPNWPDVVVSSQSITPTATLASKGTGTPTSSATTPTLPSYPSPTSGSASIYFGVHVALDSLSSITAFEADAHKAVSIIMWYQQWGLTNGWQYLQPGWMNAVRSHGAIPVITWDPENPAIGSPNQPTFTLQNITNGNFDAYITRWAQDSKAWGHPYFLRFAHEMNGYWNSWSEQANGNKPGQFVLAWRHVHDIFTRLGVSNVTWVWSPNIDYSTSTPLRELYPGGAYVDWAGMSGYNWGNIGGHVWQSFSSVFSQTYNDILSITSQPIMITETASTEQAGNKASWISDAFVTQLPNNFPRIHAFIWFNESKETNWQIESSASAQAAFASAISSRVYASNNFAGLNATPIPPL
jgi:Glycosyl hydrolase family 26